jgi:hypothetical protein
VISTRTSHVWFVDRQRTDARYCQDLLIIAGSVSDEEAREIYPDGWQSPRPYLRIVASPKPSAFV